MCSVVFAASSTTAIHGSFYFAWTNSRGLIKFMEVQNCFDACLSVFIGRRDIHGQRISDWGIKWSVIYLIHLTSQSDERINYAATCFAIHWCWWMTRCDVPDTPCSAKTSAAAVNTNDTRHFYWSSTFLKIIVIILFDWWVINSGWCLQMATHCTNRCQPMDAIYFQYANNAYIQFAYIALNAKLDIQPLAIVTN